MLRRLVLCIVGLVLAAAASGCSVIMSGTYGPFGQTPTGLNFVSATQVCINFGQCTDDPATIRSMLDKLHREYHGHGLVTPVMGSVVARPVCPICKSGILSRVYTQFWNFNPEDDGDDTPHVEDYGACNNQACRKFDSHQPIAGSNRPAPEERLPSTVVVRNSAGKNEVRILLPDPAHVRRWVSENGMWVPVVVLESGLTIRVPTGYRLPSGFWPSIPTGFGTGMIPAPAP
jgi:hypothetical protein